MIESLPLNTGLEAVFDFGCGYGPIGLTVAKLLPEATVYMSDINERAVELGIRNAQLNGITNVVIRPGDGFEAFSGQKFDMVITNPPIRVGKQVMYGLIDEAYEALHIGGWLVLVIKTKHGAKSMEAKLNLVFNNVTELDKGSGYRVYGGRK